jgi:hypothetical protein
VTNHSLVAAAPTSDIPLSRLLRSCPTDNLFVKRVKKVVSSQHALLAAKELLSGDAQKVINKLDKV